MSIRDFAARCHAEGCDPERITWRAALAIAAGALAGVAFFFLLLLLIGVML